MRHADRSTERGITPDQIGLDSKVAFLRHPETYGVSICDVVARETHMSWVFLAGEYAYKLKRPVRYEFLDFSTADLRRHFCEEELRLNRRLAPEVYLDVMPLLLTPHGELSLNGPGAPVDWLVKMKRLPAERMLDSLLETGEPQRPDLLRLADKLMNFYWDAPRWDAGRADYRRQLLNNVETNRRALLSYAGLLPASATIEAANAQADFINRNGDLIERRLTGGHVVEGHGDLRPEHVFLGPPVQVIDCIEFERKFRMLDIAEDVGSLAMECDRLGRPGVGDLLFGAYDGALSRDAPPSLLAFYKATRAMLRARLAISHLKDTDASHAAFWRDRASEYLTVCARAIANFTEF